MSREFYLKFLKNRKITGMKFAALGTKITYLNEDMPRKTLRSFCLVVKRNNLYGH